MPMLHRHIGATDHAWAADNGKIVFRTDAPSHQRLMRFTVEMQGDIDLTPLFEARRWFEGYDPTDFASVLFPASSFNAHAVAHNLYQDAYYNAVGYDNIWVSFGGRWTDRDAGGMSLRSWVNPAFVGGLVWDVDSWHWAMRASVFTQMWYGGSSFPTGSLFNGTAYDGTAYALYESVPSVQDIRVGIGVNLTLQGLYGDCLDGAAECLANTHLVLSAQYV